MADPTNEMVRMAIEPLTKSNSWDAPQVDKRNTMHLVEYPVEEETALDWPKNSGEFYLVYNSEKKNAWGERKGYRITSGSGLASTPHLTILNSTTLGDSARWAEHDLGVVLRKDTEPRSADPLNYFAPHDPIIDFNKIANHESLDPAEDEYDGNLTLYFDLGAHYVPVSMTCSTSETGNSDNSTAFRRHSQYFGAHIRILRHVHPTQLRRPRPQS